VDKDEIITALGQLSEADARDVIAQARKNDQQQRMEAAAKALRRFAGHKPATTESE
jgi:hypothetical protein